MPEGDSIFRLADKIRRTFAGKTITKAESFVVEVEPALIEGATVVEVVTHGKNLFLHLSTGRSLVVHLMMYGRVIIAPRSERARKTRETRAILANEEFMMRFERVTTLRLVRTDTLSRDPSLSQLGPDPLREDWSLPDALSRLGAAVGLSLGEAIMHQRILAGVGNVLKSEILFLCGADPFGKVEAFDEESLTQVLETTAEVLRFTVKKSSRDDRFLARRRVTRVTGLGMGAPTSSLWVYERSGRQCYVCAATIKMERQGVAKRSTYYCPKCQPRQQRGVALSPPDVGTIGRVARIFADRG